MTDDELEKLKEEKREQLEGQKEQQEKQVEQQKQQIREKAKQYLTSEARSRLGNIRAARPELASSIEAQVARLGEMGQVEKMTEEQLKDVLKKLQNSGDETDIKFRR